MSVENRVIALQTRSTCQTQPQACDWAHWWLATLRLSVRHLLNLYGLVLVLLACFPGRAFAQESLEELLRNAGDSSRPVEQTSALYKLKDRFAQEPRVVALFLSITGDTNGTFLHGKLAIQGLKQSGSKDEDVVSAMQAVVQRAMAQTGGKSDAEALAREAIQAISAIGPPAYPVSSVLAAVATNPQAWLPLRLDAVKALAAIGYAAQNAEPGLEKVFLNAKEDRELRLAAIEALACTGSSSIPAFKMLCSLITSQPEASAEELKALVTDFARLGANITSNALGRLQPWHVRSLHQEAAETARFIRAHAGALRAAPLDDADQVVAQIEAEADRRPCGDFVFWASKVWPDHPLALLGILVSFALLLLLLLLWLLLRPILMKTEIRRRIDAILHFPQTTHDVEFVQPVPAYQRIFTEGAATKADDVLAYARQCLGNEKPTKMIYLSLGGGDGTEIACAMKQGGFAKGLLIEWMDQAVDAAKAKMPSVLQAGQEVQYVTGDVAQKFAQCQRQLQDWRKEGMTGLLISAQAVLHELLWRADSKRFSWEKLVSLFDGFDVKIFHGREPCLPPLDGGWRERVRIRVPHVTVTDLCSAMELMQRHYLAYLKGDLWKAFEGEVVSVSGDCVAPGPLVVEFLHKFMRHHGSEHLRHEMQECLTAFDPEPFVCQLDAVFGGAQHVQVDYIASEGFKTEYHRFGIHAFRADNPTTQLHVPHAFCWIKAFRGEGSSPPHPPTQAPDAVTGIINGLVRAKDTLQRVSPITATRSSADDASCRPEAGHKRVRRTGAAARAPAALGEPQVSEPASTSEFVGPQTGSTSPEKASNVPGKRILFLGAHADDIEIGCGGTAAKFAATGREIAFAQAADCGSDRKKEAEAAAGLLGLSVSKGNLFFGLIDDGRLEDRKDVLQNWLRELAERFRPETIFVHRGDDTHPDHVALYQAAIRVFVRHSVLLYPIPKLAVQATPFDPNYWEDISDFLKVKLKLCACHASQTSKGIYLDPDHLTALARVAQQTGFGRTGGHAEAFRIHILRSAGSESGPGGAP